MKSILKRLGWRPKLISMDEETIRAVARTGERELCNCLTYQHAQKPKWKELEFHHDKPKQECSAWIKLQNIIDQAEHDGREVFEPGAELEWEDWTRITTLPSSISKLKKVHTLLLYGSNLVSIPPEIGGMTALRKLDLYTSYRLHWLPYEVVNCKNLQESRISTRALYGNRKYRPPFPRLRPYIKGFEPENCSICDEPFGNRWPHQFWISLNIATDVAPLLVHACSKECVNNLPAPHNGYIDKPHKGGIGQKQPARN